MNIFSDNSELHTLTLHFIEFGSRHNSLTKYKPSSHDDNLVEWVSEWVSESLIVSKNSKAHLQLKPFWILHFTRWLASTLDLSVPYHSFSTESDLRCWTHDLETKRKAYGIGGEKWIVPHALQDNISETSKKVSYVNWSGMKPDSV